MRRLTFLSVTAALFFYGCSALPEKFDPTNSNECWNLRHILSNGRTSYSDEDLHRFNEQWNACWRSYENNVKRYKKQ